MGIPTLHVYPSKPAIFPNYNSTVPLPADTIEPGTSDLDPAIGAWDVVNYCYRAAVAQKVFVHANVNWLRPPAGVPGGGMALKIFKNGNEQKGLDGVAVQPVQNPGGGPLYNIGQDTGRIVALAAGDAIDVRPWHNFGADWGIAPSLDGQGVNTECYVEIMVLS